MKNAEFEKQYIGLDDFITDTVSRYEMYYNIEDFYLYFQRYYFFIMAHSGELTPAQRRYFDNKHISGLIKLIKAYNDRYEDE